MRLLCPVSLLLLCLVASGLADAPPGYYANLEGKTWALLKAALHQRVRNHTVIQYSASGFDTGDALRVLDEAPGDSSSVRLIYGSGTHLKTDLGTAAGWNREHLWPNSYGIDGVEPAYNDLHNLRAIDATVNSSRGNMFYDDSDPQASGYRVPAHAESLGSRDADSWEPPDSQKGDIARACLYMAIRYEGGSGEPNLELTDNLAEISAAGMKMGGLTTLIVWSLLDPVSPEERQRNDRIYSLYQRNRNPFVDRPEWVTEVFGNPLQLTFAFTQGVGMTLSWNAGLRRVGLQQSTDLALGAWSGTGARRFYRE